MKVTLDEAKIKMARKHWFDLLIKIVRWGLISRHPDWILQQIEEVRSTLHYEE